MTRTEDLKEQLRQTTDELELLKEQKKKIEQRMRDIKKEREMLSVCDGKAALYSTSVYKGERPVWKVGLKHLYPQWERKGQTHIVPVVSGFDRKVVVDSIPTVIEQLQELYDKAVEKEKSGGWNE